MTMILALAACLAADMDVKDDAGLRRAIAEAGPGTTIRVAPGEYAGGVHAKDVHGEFGRPIVIRGADPKRLPVFRGGNSAFHLARVSYVELRDLVVEKAAENGINIDDGGELTRPSRHVVLAGLTVRDVGPDGNRDGIKLSGLAEFRVEGCVIERWGRGGSGIDMVGCLGGEIVDCSFRHNDGEGASGVQMKGGTRDVVVRRCRFERAGHRAVNLGGSTGMAYFRPRPEGFEGKDLTVEDCAFLGGDAAVAFVGVDGATVRRNVIYRPKGWAFRILQETRDEGFVPSRRGKIEENVIVFRSDEWKGAVNVGSGTAPETFAFSDNAWYALDDPARSRPGLPVAEVDGTYGVKPRFVDIENGDLRLDPKFPDPRGTRDR